MNYPKLKTVRVVNYQAIEDTEIELGALTVLSGEGDVGKSSFIRAIRSAFLNDGNDLDIRHDTKQCTVVLTFEDGTVIEWNKLMGKGGTYKMTTPPLPPGTVTGATGLRPNPQEYTKCGGEVPEAISLYLGIGVIKVDPTTELTPQLSDQHDQPFILWQPGSKRARIIGKATRLDVVVTAQMSCKKGLDSINRALTAGIEEAKDINKSIEDLPPFEEVGKRANECATTLQTITTNLSLATNLARLSKRIIVVEDRQTTLDLTGVKATLIKATTKLDKAVCLTNLCAQINTVKVAAEELERQLITAQTQQAINIGRYQDLCKEEGICPVCEGLLDHERCEG